MPDNREQAIHLMERFAARTGLVPGRPQRRYLWTDAFAVCNFFGLAQATGDSRFADLAMRLIDAVHTTLGRHRGDNGRAGWISGLNEEQGSAHPTHGGLRIGKQLPERTPLQPIDEVLEWERDGQYFHYLTKWMHALDQATRATGQWQFNVWARELAERAYEAFTYPVEGSSQRRMYWKMSIELSRPLVLSMGQHDPLDGYITYTQLEATARQAPDALQKPRVGHMADAFASAASRGNLYTSDPLGLGGLLLDAARVGQLSRTGAFHSDDLADLLLSAAAEGLRHYQRQDQLNMPAEQRLPFREIGLALGLRAILLVFGSGSDKPAGMKYLERYLPLLDHIDSFWSNERHQQTSNWSAHRDINEVMLATLLLPEGFVVLRAP